MDQLKIDDTTSNKSKKAKKRAAKKKAVAEVAPNGIAGRTRSRFATYVNQNVDKNKKQKVGVVYDDVMLLHRSHREEHPERPERVMAIYLNLVKKGIYKQLVEIDSDEAEMKHLVLCHPKNHVASILKAGMSKLKDELLTAKVNVRDFAIDTYQNKYTA